MDHKQTEKTNADWINALRIGGVLALVFGSFLFLIDGVSAADPLLRSLKFLGITSVLTIAGLSIAWNLREMRGARMLLGLALLSIPINFAQIGSILLDLLRGTLEPSSLALSAHAANLGIGTTALILLLIVKLVVLGALCLIACYCLYRRSGTSVCACILSLSALLLFPIREGFSFIVFGVIFAFVSGHCILRIKRILPDLASFESRAWRVVLGLPLAIYLGRSMILYDTKSYALGLGCLTLGILPAMLFPPKKDAVDTNRSLMIAALMLNFAGLALILGRLCTSVDWLMAYKFYVASLVPLLASVITGELFKRQREELLYTGLFFASFCMSVLYFHNGLVYVQCLFAFAYATAAFYLAIRARSQIRATIALGALLLAMFPLVVHALSTIAITWWTLCIAGGLCVVLASFFEKAQIQKSAVWQVLRGI